MSESNWRDILRAQQDDLKALQRSSGYKDEDDDLDADIERVLRRPAGPSLSAKSKPLERERYEYDVEQMTGDQDSLFEETENSLGAATSSSKPRPSSGKSRPSSGKAGRPQEAVLAHSTSSPGRVGPAHSMHDVEPGVESAVDAVESVATPKGAPEAASRFLKAKVKLLTRQLDEATDLKKKISDQLDGVSHQLKNDREENKQLKKRIQQLEIENKKLSSRRAGEAASADRSEAYLQEIAQLKKDVQTAEKIVKQSENDLKTKDGQLKRALETVSKLKIQLQEQSTNSAAGNAGAAQGESGSTAASASATASVARIKVLEKQRNDLIAAFRKQMKLIDLLKRQRMHIEASRLLAFTEEEFMKTLDWAV